MFMAMHSGIKATKAIRFDLLVVCYILEKKILVAKGMEVLPICFSSYLVYGGQIKPNYFVDLSSCRRCLGWM